VTTFHDAAGRVTGSRQREPRESRRL
jgi:hypothetical protein